jgi:hypothetical protein
MKKEPLLAIAAWLSRRAQQNQQQIEADPS